ncbi:MAG TPA: VWA domain-containing protein, partial [Methylobacter sp.]
MKIETSLTHEKVRYDQENEVHLVLTLTAPKKDWQNRRPPICVIPVVDISGSMNGPKLEYAKQSVIKLIDHLQPGDYCGLAAFSTDVYPIAPPREMTQAQKEELKSKVGAMAQISSTNFSGGLLQGLAWGREVDLSEGVVVRVIMFTDG